MLKTKPMHTHPILYVPLALLAFVAAQVCGAEGEAEPASAKNTAHTTAWTFVSIPDFRTVGAMVIDKTGARPRYLQKAGGFAETYDGRKK